MSPSSDPADDPTLSRRRLLGAAAVAGAAGLAGCNASLVEVRTKTTTVERRFDAADVSLLRVVDTDDDVSVEHTDDDAVRVRAHKRAHGETTPDDLALRSDVQGGTLTLGTRVPPVVGIGGGSVDLEVFLPPSVDVGRVETTDGTVALGDVSGSPTVDTDDGDVTATGLAGDLDAATDDGDVTVERTDGAVSARSNDGDVVVRSPGRVVDLSTDDGDVTAEVPAVDGDATVRTDDGDVAVRLGTSLDATVEATSRDGDVVVSGGLDGVEAATGSRIVATLGDGSNDLRVRTDDGDVTISTQ